MTSGLPTRARLTFCSSLRIRSTALGIDFHYTLPTLPDEHPPGGRSGGENGPRQVPARLVGKLRQVVVEGARRPAGVLVVGLLRDREGPAQELGVLAGHLPEQLLHGPRHLPAGRPHDVLALELGGGRRIEHPHPRVERLRIRLLELLQDDDGDFALAEAALHDLAAGGGVDVAQDRGQHLRGRGERVVVETRDASETQLVSDLEDLVSRATPRALLPLGERGQAGLEALHGPLHLRLGEHGLGEGPERGGNVRRRHGSEQEDAECLQRRAPRAAGSEHDSEGRRIDGAEHDADDHVPDDELAHDSPPEWVAASDLPSGSMTCLQGGQDAIPFWNGRLATRWTAPGPPRATSPDTGPAIPKQYPDSP